MTIATEIVFVVEDDPDGGFTARALGQFSGTQAESFEGLKTMVREAVRCHFDDEARMPRVIRLHDVRDEVIAA